MKEIDLQPKHETTHDQDAIDRRPDRWDMLDFDVYRSERERALRQLLKPITCTISITPPPPYAFQALSTGDLIKPQLTSKRKGIARDR